MKKTLAATFIAAQLSMAGASTAQAGKVLATYPDGSQKTVPCEGVYKLDDKPVFTCNFGKAADKNNQDACPIDAPIHSIKDLAKYPTMNDKTNAMLTVRNAWVEHYAQVHQDCEKHAIYNRLTLQKAGQYNGDLFYQIKDGWRERNNCTVKEIVKDCEAKYGLPELK
ncbi:MAG: hypothetical protein KTR28_03110 [Micavibrio sp.]|nr:hypothetical protein [Micavibrio sp.]